VEVIFGQPAFAAAFIAACLVLGLFLAEVRLSRAAADQNHRFIREYVRLIDPRIQSLTTPTAGPVPPRP
jgi:hypothetical protein